MQTTRLTALIGSGPVKDQLTDQSIEKGSYNPGSQHHWKQWHPYHRPQRFRLRQSQKLSLSDLLPKGTGGQVNVTA